MGVLKFGAVALSVALLSACGGGSSSDAGGDSGGGDGVVVPPVQTVSFVLGDYQSLVSVDESETVEVLIPFTGASGPVSLTVSHSLPLSYSVEVGTDAAVVELNIGDILAYSELGDVEFSLSDSNSTVSGVFAVEIANTSAEVLLDQVEGVVSAFPLAHVVSDHRKVFSAYGEIARYSGSISEAEFAESVASFGRGLDYLSDLCNGCEGELSLVVDDFEGGVVSEEDVREALTSFVVEFSEYVDVSLRGPLNTIAQSAGFQSFPSTSFVNTDGYGFSAFVGNAAYGDEVEGVFVFSGDYAALNDVLGVGGVECDVLGDVE